MKNISEKILLVLSIRRFRENKGCLNAWRYHGLKPEDKFRWQTKSIARTDDRG